MQLTRLMVPQSKWNIKCPFSMVADGIVVHNTANKASAMAEISYMVGNNNQVSYHYAIDDYRIVQGVEENRNTWNAGDGTYGKGNRNKISIEICYSTGDLEQFKKAELLTAKFIAYKLKEKGWGIDRVSKHQDYSGKNCPHKTLELGWERFLNLIRAELGQLQEPIPAQQPFIPSNSANYTVKINTADLNVRDGAGVNNKINTVVHQNEVYTIVAESNGWGKLKSGAGWINLSYTKRTDSKPAATPTSKYVLGLYVVNASGLNVRSGPGVNYSKKKVYAKGTKFDTYEIKNNWARTPSGWVCLDYCSLIRKY